MASSSISGSRVAASCHILVGDLQKKTKRKKKKPREMAVTDVREQLRRFTAELAASATVQEYVQQPSNVWLEDTSTRWGIALTTVFLVAVLQLHRFWCGFLSESHPVREVVTLVLALAGLLVFVSEVHRGRFYEGLLKLVALLLLADVFIPNMWPVRGPGRTLEVNPEEEDDEIVLLAASSE